MATDQDITDAVTSALLGELYVGQRVKVKEAFGGLSAGAKVVVTEILPIYVRIAPPLFSDGVWHPDWFEPDYD